MIDTDGDYTIEEVAAKLRKSLYTVRALAKAGRLPGAYQLTPRGRWSVRRLDFDQWHAGLGPAQTDPNRIERTARAQARRRKRAA